ncbi:MAG: STAS domain-containing protein [Pararhodobacter sp.]|nr:STAS domain-containing protein [Pararhodobacter sp.]
MEIVPYRHAEGLVIRVNTARIDAAVAIEFKEAVRQAASGPGNPVILDLSQVSFLDSSGLGAVVAVMKLLAPERALHLAGLTPSVAKVFRLTRMDTIFTIHDHAPGGTANPLKAAG